MKLLVLIGVLMLTSCNLAGHDAASTATANDEVGVDIQSAIDEGVPTITYPVSVTAQRESNLVVGTKGQFWRKRPGWKIFQPVGFGDFLDIDDLLKSDADSSAIIVCSDLTLIEIGPEYLGNLPCSQDQELFRRGLDLVVTPLRSTIKLQEVPFVISPRYTFLLTPQPIFKWHSTESPPYTVQVWSADSVWQDVTDLTEYIYPDDAPTLEPGQTYYLTVIDSTGHSSNEEDSPIDLGFAVFSPEEREELSEVLERVDSLTSLDAPARQLLIAEVLHTFQLRGASIEQLEDLAVSAETPSVLLHLGYKYLEIGLYFEAIEPLERAYNQFKAEDNLYGTARAAIGLGHGFTSLNDKGSAAFFSSVAFKAFEELGDEEGMLLAAHQRSTINP